MYTIASLFIPLAVLAAAALPANADGNRRRAEFYDHLPNADRHHQAVPGNSGQGGKANWRQR